MAEQTVPVEVYYRLAGSRLDVSGSVESSTDWDGADHVTKTSDVQLSVAADRRNEALVRFPRPTEHGTYDLTLKLAPDGRLLSASGSVQGILAEVVSAGATLVGFVAGIAARVLAPGVRSEADTPSPTKAWEATDDGRRLKTAAAVLGELHAAIVQTSRAMASAGAPAKVYRKLVGLQAAAAAVEAEVTVLNTRRDAWYATTYVQSETYTFVLYTDELFRPRTPIGLPPRTLARDALDDGSSHARAVLDTLGLALVEVSRHGDRETPADRDDETDLESDVERGALPLGVYFRVPRPCAIAFYKAQETGEDLVLERVERYWAVDGNCRLGSIPLEGKGSPSASIDFSATGAPETIAVSAQDRLAEALTALAGAPAKLSEGLGSAKTAVEAYDALSASRAAREVAALENRKTALEAVLSASWLESGKDKTETLQEVKDRLERLKTMGEIEKLEHPTPSTDEDKRDAENLKQLERVQVALATKAAQTALAAFAGPSS
jgi:hypothetical protein